MLDAGGFYACLECVMDGSLIGTGGAVTWIIDYIGITAPVVA
jgi:hypothetical protein